MPHKPTPPESRKPPSGIIDSVGANRMSNRFTRSSRAKSRVAREDAERSEQDDEIDERHEADRRSERQVEDAPEQSDRQDQHGDQDQERLAGAGVLVVKRIGANQRHPGAHGIGDDPGATHRVHARDATRGTGEPGSRPRQRGERSAASGDVDHEVVSWEVRRLCLRRLRILRTSAPAANRDMRRQGRWQRRRVRRELAGRAVHR